MTLTFTVDGTSLPLPSADGPYELEYQPFGVAQRMASSLLRVQYIASKYQVKINWRGLTLAERDSLRGTWGTYLQQAGLWVFPDGLTFTGLCAMASWSETPDFNPWDSAYDRYQVSFTVLQQ